MTVVELEHCVNNFSRCYLGKVNSNCGLLKLVEFAKDQVDSEWKLHEQNLKESDDTPLLSPFPSDDVHFLQHGSVQL